MNVNSGLTMQSLKGAALAAYVGALVAFILDTAWRVQMGTDARMCPEGSRELTDFCTIGELSLAVLFDFFWAIFGSFFALVFTIPCALALGRLAPFLEHKFNGKPLALTQYGLATAIGLAAGFAIQAVLPAIFAANVGVWAFRKARYGNTGLPFAVGPATGK